MLNKIRRSYNILHLTRKYFRANQIPEECCVYNINGFYQAVYGKQALSMLIDIVINDAYGLKRFKYLDNIVDVGANIGVFSLHAATLFPNAKILAYEPFNTSKSLLKKNITKLNVDLNPYAVGAVTKKVNLNYESDLSAVHIYSNGDSTGESQECEMLSLDDVAAKLESSIGLLKLDCEGSEYEIMQTSSFEKVSYIVGELHTCQSGNPALGLKVLEQKSFVIDKWIPFPDGESGIFWASNSNNTLEKRAWLF